MNDWKPIDVDNPPPRGVPLMTKIDDHHGARNEQILHLRETGWLWWTDLGRDGIYVYYSPTHWCPVSK